jgi:predicted small secreted protein
MGRARAALSVSAALLAACNALSGVMTIYRLRKP